MDTGTNEFCLWCTRSLADFFFGESNELDGSTWHLIAQNEEFKKLGVLYGFIKENQQKEMTMDDVEKETIEKEELKSDEFGGQFYDKILPLCSEAVLLAKEISIMLVNVYCVTAMNNRDQLADESGDLADSHAERLTVQLNNLTTQLRTPGSIVDHTHFALLVDILRACLTPEDTLQDNKRLYEDGNGVHYFRHGSDPEMIFVGLPKSTEEIFNNAVSLFNDISSAKETKKSLAGPLCSIGFDIYGSTSLLLRPRDVL